MKYLLTNAQMRAADEFTIKSLGVPSLELMERAGDALAREAAYLAPEGKILCVCGGGNNGGDGFVCGRKLLLSGRHVDAVFVGSKTSEECEINKSEFEMNGGKIYREFPETDYALVIDCLFGTGYTYREDECTENAVRHINILKRRGVKVLCADIPSCVSGDSGLAIGGAVEADVTLCIGEVKLGAVLGDGADCAGEIKRVDIGIALPDFDCDGNGYAYLVEENTVAGLLPKRKHNSHKGSYGYASIVAGSYAYTGAAHLSTAAAVRSGAGYTTLYVPEEILPHYILKTPEALLCPISKGKTLTFKENVFSKIPSGAVAYGMGLGATEDVCKGAEYLITHHEGTLILDADAINSLAGFERKRLKKIFAKKTCEIVLTPHPKEFARLLGASVSDVLENGLSLAKAFAKEYGVTVLLKGAATVITDGVKVAVNAEGNAGQAKGGSGDVLSGVIAGLCASALTAFDGAVCGAFLSGRAANLAAKETGEYSLTATDVIAYLGKAFLSLRA